MLLSKLTPKVVLMIWTEKQVHIIGLSLGGSCILRQHFFVSYIIQMLYISRVLYIFRSEATAEAGRRPSRSGI